MMIPPAGPSAEESQLPYRATPAQFNRLQSVGELPDRFYFLCGEQHLASPIPEASG